MKKIEIIVKDNKGIFRQLDVIEVAKSLDDYKTMERVKLHLVRNHLEVYLSDKYLWRELTQIDELMKDE